MRTLHQPAIWAKMSQLGQYINMIYEIMVLPYLTDRVDPAPSRDWSSSSAAASAPFPTARLKANCMQLPTLRDEQTQSIAPARIIAIWCQNNGTS